MEGIERHDITPMNYADGLVNIFSTVKTTPLAKDLPPNYRAVLEWGRITFVL